MIGAVHPYLQDPERARAFEHLARQTAGTTRQWAEQLGWKRGKLNRFLDSVRRYRLADVETTPFGSRFRPCPGVLETDAAAEPERGRGAVMAGPQPDHGRTTLGSTGFTRSSGPSERKPGTASGNDAGEAVPWSALAARMIPVINEEFTRLLGEYRPIRPDSIGSHRAGHMLEKAEVDEVWCEQRLRQLCRVFNPSKHGGGEPPRTLAYFVGGLIRDWQQYSLPLLTKATSPAPAPPSPTPRPVHVAERLPDPAPASDPTRWRREISLERKDLSRIGADDVRRASGG